MRSMTGFGKAVYQDERVQLSVEFRAVNNRYLDLQLSLPPDLRQIEARLKKILQQELHRGRVDCSIHVRRFDQQPKSVLIEEDLTRDFISALDRLKSEFGINDELRIDHILQTQEIVHFESRAEDIPEWLIDIVEETVKKALDGLNGMRSEEGRELQEKIKLRLSEISEKIQEVKGLQNESQEEIFSKLSERLKAFASDIQIEEGRLAQEVALSAERSDISEEIERLESHVVQFGETLSQEGTVGKKMDFLLQEMNREVNTLNSKTRGIKINRLGVEIKLEIEKIREQIQNIE